MNIEKVSNGYILVTPDNQKEICPNIERVFDRLLLIYEGRSKYFGGDKFGQVVILKKEK